MNSSQSGPNFGTTNNAAPGNTNSTANPNPAHSAYQSQVGTNAFSSNQKNQVLIHVCDEAKKRT